jgi:hypothetical protein
MANAINVIHPYYHEGTLVFDDASKGLDKEPFVGEADVVLAELSLARLGVQLDKFTLIFSGDKFPGATDSATWIEKDCGGNVYSHDQSGRAFWLCPALLKYFDSPPRSLWVQFKKIEKNPFAKA